MDKKQYKVLTFDRSPRQELIGNLAMPSTTHAYSLCVQYIKTWFMDILKKVVGEDFIPEDNVFIDGRFLFADFIQINTKRKLATQTAALSIVPKIDTSYNHDNQYMKVLGVENYIRRTAASNGFFNDVKKNMHINVEMRTIEVEFNMTIQVNTRAQQLDISEMLKIACRIGWTGSEEKDLDFHVPYRLMIQVAKDAGFEVVDDAVVNPTLFLRYLNSHSSLPFTYKMRGVNGKREFFLRIKRCYIHCRYNSIEIDDGERVGQISQCFNIMTNLTCRFPCPNFYVYYSEYKNDIPVGVETFDKSMALAMYAIKITKFPDIDENGWELSMTADVEEKDHSKPLSINLEELFASDNDYNDILFMINRCKEIYISPSIFLNFKIYNMAEPVAFKVDWDRMVIETNTVVTGDINSFAIYVNYSYLNEQLVEAEEYYKDRIN